MQLVESVLLQLLLLISEYGVGNQVTTLGDVYSYGVLLLEMFTGKRPTDIDFGDVFGLRKYVQMALPGKMANVIDQWLLPEMENDKQDKSNSNKSRDLRIACITSILRIGLSCSEHQQIARKLEML